MSVSAVHFSGETDQWATPADLFAALDREFCFSLDVCALPENAKCEAYFTPEVDGLRQEWQGTCWMNPPYGRKIGAWMQKAYESAQQGATVVCLVPSRTDTEWWHRYAGQASEIRFLKGRLRFGLTPNERAPFPSALVVFRPGSSQPDVKFVAMDRSPKEAP